MNQKYGESFKQLGIPGMGRQGATWCELDAHGVLVLMAHQNYFHKRNGSLVYEMPRKEKMPPRGTSATRSLKLIGSYFAPDKSIILPVAVFVTDGGVSADGTWEPSVFKHATGDVFRARMKDFDPTTGYLLCAIDERFSI